MTLTELSIKRPSIIVVIFSVLTVLGLFGLSELKYELLPKITPPWVTVVTVYPGGSPQEVEASITRTIEDAVSGVDKVKTVLSTSAEGVSFVSIEFLISADVNLSLQDIQRKVNEIVSRLPAGVKSPVISKFAIDELPVLRIGTTANMPASPPASRGSRSTPTTSR